MALPIKLALPEHFLDEEVRCEYTVTSKLKKIWAVELDLLNELLRVCRKHGIKVAVFGGTLLGAVRHRGFIPWDDDLDIALDRENFNKLCAVAPSEFKHPYFLQTARSDRRFYFAYARLRNSETTAVITGHETPDYNNGIYIDVYVLEGYTDSKLKWKIQTFLQILTVKFLTLYYQGKRRNNSLKERILRLPRPFVRMFKYETLMRLYEGVLGMYTKSSSRIGIRDEMTETAKHYWFFKHEFDDIVELPFENLMVPAPAEYVKILSRIFGDFMKFPPPEKRGAWHEGQITFDPDVGYERFLKCRDGKPNRE